MLKTKMLTATEVAKRLGVCRNTIYKTVKNPNNKHLTYYDFPFGIRFEEEDIEKFKQHFKKNRG